MIATWIYFVGRALSSLVDLDLDLQGHRNSKVKDQTEAK